MISIDFVTSSYETSYQFLKTMWLLDVETPYTYKLCQYWVDRDELSD